MSLHSCLDGHTEHWTVTSQISHRTASSFFVLYDIDDSEIEVAAATALHLARIYLQKMLFGVCIIPQPVQNKAPGKSFTEYLMWEF